MALPTYAQWLENSPVPFDPNNPGNAFIGGDKGPSGWRAPNDPQNASMGGSSKWLGFLQQMQKESPQLAARLTEKIKYDKTISDKAAQAQTLDDLYQLAASLPPPQGQPQAPKKRFGLF